VKKESFREGGCIMGEGPHYAVIDQGRGIIYLFVAGDVGVGVITRGQDA
jgi:hypothetical protein